MAWEQREARQFPHSSGCNLIHTYLRESVLGYNGISFWEDMHRIRQSVNYCFESKWSFMRQIWKLQWKTVGWIILFIPSYLLKISLEEEMRQKKMQRIFCLSSPLIDTSPPYKSHRDPLLLSKIIRCTWAIESVIKDNPASFPSVYYVLSGTWIITSEPRQKHGVLEGIFGKDCNRWLVTPFGKWVGFMPAFGP